MNCGSCGTRVSDGQRNCPNCGRTISKMPSMPPSSGDSSGSSGVRGLSPSSAQVLDERDGLRDASSTRSGSRSSKKVMSRRPSSEVSLDREVEPEPEVAEVNDPKGMSPKQIRAMVHDRPDRLERGLSIYTDAAKKPVGIDFETDIGRIDLLARDDAGGLVAVMVMMGDDGAQSGKELVSAALERVGWVRKHVAEPEQEVRAIVLLDQVPDDTSYAAAAVASTVSFKTCRVEVRFAEVKL